MGPHRISQTRRGRCLLLGPIALRCHVQHCRPAAELGSEARYTEEALKRVQRQGMPLIIAQVVELVSDDYAIVDDGEGRPHGHYVRVHDVVDRARLKPSVNVFLHASSSLAVLEDLPADADAGAIVSSLLVADGERRGVTYDDVAGCEALKWEVCEAVELSLTHPERFTHVGMDPSCGVPVRPVGHRQDHARQGHHAPDYDGVLSRQWPRARGEVPR